MNKKEVNKVLSPVFNKKPRNPHRISELLLELNTLWLKYPDLRFFQLVSWLSLEGIDMFNVEDDWTLARIKELQKL